MTTSRSEEILAAIRSLPSEERLRLVERVIHDVAEAQAEVGAPLDPREIIGLFRDKPDLIDEVCDMAMRAREAEPFRATDV